MTRVELDLFYGGGAGQFWPDIWKTFVDLIPLEERDDLILAYQKRLFCGDMAVEHRYAQAWASWENSLASVHYHGGGSAPGDYARAFARIENHYFSNDGFLEFDGQILAHMDRIAHIPGVIVQGRYDMICPPQRAWELSQNWPAGELQIIRNAGHALSEPGISEALVRAMERFAAR